MLIKPIAQPLVPIMHLLNGGSFYFQSPKYYVSLPQLLQILSCVNPILDCREMARGLSLSKGDIPSLKAVGSHCTFL